MSKRQAGASPASRARCTCELIRALHDKRRGGPLTEEEEGEEQALLSLYRETVLVRAQAAVLLKQRGYDVADPSQFAPLE